MPDRDPTDVLEVVDDLALDGVPHSSIERVGRIAVHDDEEPTRRVVPLGQQVVGATDDDRATAVERPPRRHGRVTAEGDELMPVGRDGEVRDAARLRIEPNTGPLSVHDVPFLEHAEAVAAIDAADRAGDGECGARSRITG